MVNQRISLKDVEITIGNKVLGGAEEASVSAKRDNTFAYEGGNYAPVEIVEGKFDISGELTRAFIDVTLLNEIFPLDQALLPSFDITATITSGKTPGRTITLHGVKFDSIDISSLSMDGYAKNKLPFKALKLVLS